MSKAGLGWLADLVPPIESAYPIRSVEGSLPPYFRGSYYLIGPASSRAGKVDYDHWLDGDGMVSKLEFRVDGVFFRNRFVASRKRTVETDAGQAVFRTFGTSFPGDRLKRGIGLESPVNVSVVVWRGQLLAFGEQGAPWQLDPSNLRTLREFDFGGVLGPIAPFSAHPSVDYANGELVNFGISFSPRSPRLNLFRFGADGRLIYRRPHALDAPRSVHDFLLTPDYIIVHISGYVLDIEAVLDRGCTILEALDWQPELGSFLLVFDRNEGALQARIPVGNAYCLHLANAFCIGDRLTVDSIEYPQPIYPHYRPFPDLYTNVPRGRPVRRVIDTGRWQLHTELAIDYSKAPDFPHIDPRLKGDAANQWWMLGISAAGQPGPTFFDELVRLDWGENTFEAFSCAEGSVLGGEPVFVPDPAQPGSGSIICQNIETSTGKACFLVFDANEISSGPRARLCLEEPIPPGFHACFDPEPANEPASSL